MYLRGRFSGPTVLIGLGLLIFPLWGSLLTHTGEPAVTAGFALAFLAAGCAYSLWYFRSRLRLGTPWLYVPVLTFVLIALVQLVLGRQPLSERLTLLVYYCLMAALFFTAKQKGESLLWFAVPAVLIYGTNAVVDAVLHLGTRAHGLSANPNTLASLLLFSVFALRGRWRWLIPLAVAAMLCTGSYWAVGGLAAAGAVYLVLERKRFRQFAALAAVTICLVVLLAAGGLYTGVLQGVWQVSDVAEIVHSGSSIDAFDQRTFRLLHYRYALDTFSWLGNGGIGDDLISLHYDETKLHSTPAMVLYELGPFALLAWLVASCYVVLRVRRYRYLMLAVVFGGLIGSYDFWHWTSLGSYYFLTLGLAGENT